MNKSGAGSEEKLAGEGESNAGVLGVGLVDAGGMFGEGPLQERLGFGEGHFCAPVSLVSGSAQNAGFSRGMDLK